MNTELVQNVPVFAGCPLGGFVSSNIEVIPNEWSPDVATADVCGVDGATPLAISWTTESRAPSSLLLTQYCGAIDIEEIESYEAGKM